mgnify:CR=1 FL=1
MKQEALVFVAMCFAMATMQFAGAQSESEGKPAGLRLPSVFGDHMVLQRDVRVPIWGWAEPGEKITVQLGRQEVAAQAGREGKWMVKLPAMQAGVFYNIGGMALLSSGDLVVADANPSWWQLVRINFSE